jgi:hypothetical protein
MKTPSAIMRAVFLSLIFTSQAVATALTPTDLFIDDKITQFSISPTGEYIAYVSPLRQSDLFTIVKIDGMKTVMTKKWPVNITWVNMCGLKTNDYYCGLPDRVSFMGPSTLTAI